jgi:hypothetical protein
MDTDFCSQVSLHSLINTIRFLRISQIKADVDIGLKLKYERVNQTLIEYVTHFAIVANSIYCMNVLY